MNNRIIFLDIDGVVVTNVQPNINSDLEKHNLQTIVEKLVFDSECLSNLKVVIEKTGAKIVISSNWRKSIENLVELLICKGVKEDWLHDQPVTPYRVTGSSKIYEIGTWLGRCNENVDYIIVDDEDIDDVISKKFTDRFFRTDPESGFSNEIARKILQHWHVR